MYDMKVVGAKRHIYVLVRRFRRAMALDCRDSSMKCCRSAGTRHVEYEYELLPSSQFLDVFALRSSSKYSPLVCQA